MKGIVSERHSRGLRATNLLLLGDDMQRVFTQLKRDLDRDTGSKTSIYRCLKTHFRELQCGFGFSAEYGVKKKRTYHGFFFAPDTNFGLVSVISFIPARDPGKLESFDGPLMIRRHALDRLHQRLGTLDRYAAWAREFQVTLQTTLLFFRKPEVWLDDAPDALLPTENGALLGLFEKRRFVGRTWMHRLDLDPEKQATADRICSFVQRQTKPSPEDWARLLDWKDQA